MHSITANKLKSPIATVLIPYKEELFSHFQKLWFCNQYNHILRIGQEGLALKGRCP